MAGRKRRVVHDEDEPANMGDDAPQAIIQDRPQEDRREQMAQIARRRAAHFATFDDAGDTNPDNEDNPHIGGEAARNLGPWSSAVQLVNSRQKQRSKRDEKILKAARDTTTLTSKIPKWRPTRDIHLGKRYTSSTVLPLSHFTLRCVVDLIDQVETLWGLPDLLKIKIAHEICARRALTPETFKLFTENTPVEISLPNCTGLDQESLCCGLIEAATPKLEKLDAGLCGRGFTDHTAMSIAQHGILSSLKALRLSGAYRLSDSSIIALIKKSPHLEELSLPHCSRLEGQLLSHLPELAPNLKVLDLSECRGLNRYDIANAIHALKFLEHVSLDGIPDVDDAFLSALVGSTGTAEKKSNGNNNNNNNNNNKTENSTINLKSISLKRHSGITDKGLSLFLSSCPFLQKIHLDECAITNSTLIEIARHCSQMEDVSFSRCYSIDDDGIRALTALGTLKKVNMNSLTRISDASIQFLIENCRSTLEELDLSWCRSISKYSLGNLADSCPLLKKLVLWGCTQADDEFLNGHSNENLHVIGRGERLVNVSL